MLNDLCRGLSFLHNSSVKYHGNLKSSNCLIDSRWTLKLTDFGLPKIYSNQNSSLQLKASDLLWTAPEHLRKLSNGSEAGDIFALSIIMQEIIVEGYPYCMMNLSHCEIIERLKSESKPIYRPIVSKRMAPAGYVEIMEDCWNERPEMRPSIENIHSLIMSLNGNYKDNIVDWMIKTIEDYTTKLEKLVDVQTHKLKEEKRKVLKILKEIFPKPIVEKLVSGQPVLPEQFDMVTIYFSDIVGFTTISAFSSPIEVVTLLNDLYTILRIGLHSGACVTGVVGLKMPRYCLFGDTVNTASRMESTSQAYRIHVSESCADILKEIGGYHLEYRGLVDLPGKGRKGTYWLTGKTGFNKELPTAIENDKNHGVDDCLIKRLKKIKSKRLEKSVTESSDNITYSLFENKSSSENLSSPDSIQILEKRLVNPMEFFDQNERVICVSEKKPK
ncbi:retinal guanylyl cyclase 2 [Brachionus plicatilis]|uniref:Guanylate cyclase n=1 Tax=Brachionus plicatilis TaxID=10195 RepID=A0A3M7T9A3_BRAPC|nr:retinal guanylyl cyclase 2 [Brachionus plicatilis]